jgi:hypothetical protein
MSYKDFCLTFSMKNITYVHVGYDKSINLKSVHFVGFSFIHHSSIPLACAECDNSLPFSGTSTIPLCYILFPATLLHQLFFHPPSLHLAINFFIYLLVLLIPNSYAILFWEFYFLPFSVHVQTNTIYVALWSLLW